MNRLLTCTAVALIIGLTPTLAAEDTSDTSKSSAGQTTQKDMNTNESGTSSAPATQPGATPEASKAAKEPATGSADTSGGATERSSAPPESEAATQQKSMDEANQPAQGSPDPSGGAKERSSAPPGSSAADPSKPNPALGETSPGGAEGQMDQDKTGAGAPTAGTDSGAGAKPGKTAGQTGTSKFYVVKDTVGLCSVIEGEPSAGLTPIGEKGGFDTKDAGKQALQKTSKEAGCMGIVE